MLFKFLSTLSLRRATYIGVAYIVAYIFLSTLSLRRATKAIIECNGGDPISIHALLAESDLPQSKRRAPTDAISIHALLAESDHPALYEADGGA